MVVGTETLIEIHASAPMLDAVGMNTVWYKWSFYNDDIACDTNRFENYCFLTAPIDGKKSGYMYTTYVHWTDFYDKDETMTFYWFIFALSFFGWLGIIPQILIAIAL